MTSSVIHSILKELNPGSASLIRFRVTGDQLDIMVVPDVNASQITYRSSVIQVGQFISKIKIIAANRGYKIIQNTFPTFDNAHLIASIRLISHSGNNKSSDSKTVVQKQFSLSDELKALAVKHGLMISATNCKEFLPQESPASHKLVKLVDASDQCFKITSTFDNPFIWLKTGCFIHESSIKMEQISSELNTEIFFELDELILKKHKETDVLTNHLQAIIFAKS